MVTEIASMGCLLKDFHMLRVRSSLQKEDPDSGTESDRDWSNAANVRDVMIFALNAGKMLYVHQSLFSNQFTDHRVPPVSNMCPATAILQPHGISDSSQGLSCCFSDCDDNSDSELISINYKSGHLTPESEDDDEDWELEEIFTQSEINRCHAQRQCVSSGRNRLSVDEGFLDDSPEPLQFSNTPPEGLSHCYTLSPQEFLACSNVPISPLTHQH